MFVSEITGCDKDNHGPDETAMKRLTDQLCNSLAQSCICCGKDIRDRRGGAKYCFPCYLEIEEEIKRLNKIIRKIAVFRVRRRHLENAVETSS